MIEEILKMKYFYIIRIIWNYLPEFLYLSDEIKRYSSNIVSIVYINIYRVTNSNDNDM